MAVLGTVPTAALAESVPAPQMEAYGVDWIARVPASNWPAPADRPAVCIVDTGIAVTPDTPATSPDGPIIARLAIDGGSGEPQGTTDEYMHGTQMAAQIVAPVNGWGIVGVWPQARLISVRASIGADTGFSSGAYINGAKMCMNWALDNNVKLAAISLSLGDTASGNAEAIRVQDMTVQAHARGISVVAAGGNVAGDATPYPARGDGVLAVGAGSTPAGSWCSYATHDSHTDIVGPACPVAAPYLPTGAESSYDGGGSSTATAVVAGTLGALRSLVPGSTWQQAESWVLSGSYGVSGVPILDGVAAANAAGIAGLVTPIPAASTTPTPEPVPAAAMPTSTPASGGGAPAQTPTPTLSTPVIRRDDIDDAEPAQRLPKPARLTATLRAGHLTVTSRAPVPGARLQITVRYGGRAHAALATRGRSKVTIAAPSTAASLSVVWRATDKTVKDSRATVLRRPRAGWNHR